MKILRVGEVAERCGIGRSTVWAKAKSDPTWPRAVKIGGITGWIESEVDAWLAAKVAESRAKGQAGK